MKVIFSAANIIEDGKVRTIDFTKLYTEELNARNNALSKMKEEFAEEIKDEGRRASRIGTNIGQYQTLIPANFSLNYYIII